MSLCLCSSRDFKLIFRAFWKVPPLIRTHVQCLSLKCRPQHGGWWCQPLIAQVPAGKSKAIPPLHGVQLSKLKKKIIAYLITWDVGNVVLHPHISGIFLGNVHLYRLIKFLKYSQFHAWYLLSILLMCGGLLLTLYFSKIAKPHTVEELKESIRHEIDCISEI